MCADCGHLADEIHDLEQAGATSFHLDIMDGIWVPNFALSWSQVEYCRKQTKLPLEVHLMVDNIEPHIKFIKNNCIQLVYIHAENHNIIKFINELHILGANVGLAVNPETSISKIRNLLPEITHILAMRVPPGFAGQKPLKEYDEKIKQLAFQYPNIHITIDGGVTLQDITEFSKFGVKGFVLGTSSIFGKKMTYQQLLGKLSNN